MAENGLSSIATNGYMQRKTDKTIAARISPQA
jgi:hypothetical protein